MSCEVFPYAEGYVKATPIGSGYAFNYVFTYTDHYLPPTREARPRGRHNIRLKYAQHPSDNNKVKILEEDHYYSYGLKHQGYNGQHLVFDTTPGGGIVLSEESLLLKDSYRYKFGGMEYQDEFDINTYDFGARNYDPALGRWMNIDPLAEYMYTHSPYGFSFNNPIYYIDPDGQMPMPLETTEIDTNDISFDTGGNISFGGGGCPDGNCGDTVNQDNPIELDEVVVVGNSKNAKKGVDGGVANWGNGTEDNGHKEGTILGDMDINQLPTTFNPGGGSTGNRIMEWLRTMIDFFLLKKRWMAR